MKPFKYKNKISFGDFKSPVEAARAVDAAFFYYDKNSWRNFRDSPRFLKPLPEPLTEEAKLKFVKEQARSLAFRAHNLPSTRDPANRREELMKRTSPRTPVEPVSHMPATSTCNLNERVGFQAIREEGASTSLRSCVTENSSESIQFHVRLEALDLVEEGHSQETLHPATKTLCATADSGLEMFPEIADIPDDNELQLLLRPLDVTDYTVEYSTQSWEDEYCSVLASADEAPMWYATL